MISCGNMELFDCQMMDAKDELSDIEKFSKK